VSFVDFIIFLMSSAGLTAIIVGSHIFSVPRDFLSEKSESIAVFLGCPMCVGFWVGLIMSMTLPFFVNVFMAGFSASLFSWAAYTFVDAANSVASHFDNFDNIDTGEE